MLAQRALVTGSPGRTRTDDPWLERPVLSRSLTLRGARLLSYGTVWRGGSDSNRRLLRCRPSSFTNLDTSPVQTSARSDCLAKARLADRRKSYSIAKKTVRQPSFAPPTLRIKFYPFLLAHCRRNGTRNHPWQNTGPSPHGKPSAPHIDQAPLSGISCL